MAILVQQSVKRTLFGMAFPMLAGTFAMNAYSLTDAWFISRLGTLALAAMGFTIPVIMLLTFVAGGLATGVTTLVSHALGRHDHSAAARMVTHGIVLMLGVTASITFAGYLCIDPIFIRLGADQETLPLIRAFMSIWYLGAIFASLPWLGNGVLISSGDSKAASRLMVLGTLLNLALNPILIFGCFGIPALGIRGSALATVIAQAVSTVWLFHLLHKRHRLLVWGIGGFSGCLASFRQILAQGIPCVLSMILMPVSAAVVTRILGDFGHEAVAACGAAGRIEMFAFVIPMALGMSLTPFVSQNFGAKRTDRIREAMALSTVFAFVYGGGVAILFYLSAVPLASLFTDDPKVAVVLSTYIRIISFGYGMVEVHRYCGFILTGLQKPASATLLNAVRVLVLLIPLSCAGAAYGGVEGVFWGRLVTDIVGGCIGLVWVRRVLRACPAAMPNPDEGMIPK